MTQQRKRDVFTVSVVLVAAVVGGYVLPPLDIPWPGKWVVCGVVGGMIGMTAYLFSCDLFPED